ncbi:MAG: phosphopantothenoylcysteine decarboxylase, partial [Bacteroidaceae bacterium]
ITAGPTYEQIDPVRFIGNFSSGKMGMALADVFARKGAHVTVIAGPGVPRPIGLSREKITMIDVVSAQQMYDEVQVYRKQTIVVLCAAVADFTPEHCEDRKIKRVGDQLVLKLSTTKDIAASVGRNRSDNQTIVGFALETNDALQHAQEKRKNKQLDMIVMNSLEDKGAGFGVDTNQVTLISDKGNRSLPLMSKMDVAEEIVSEIIKLRT